MKLSCIVTYYNQENHVEKSLNSILSQKTDYDYEILVGDDGSDDKTPEIVQKYIEKYPGKIKLFIMPRDKNVKYNPIHRASANRLNALKHAAGEYFCILDGDDYYCSDTFVQNAVTILDNNKSLCGCAFDYKMIYPDKEVMCKNNLLPDSVICSKKFVKGCYIPSGAMIFRNCIKDEHLQKMIDSKNFDDTLITISMLEYGKLYYKKETAYAYTQSDNSIWNSIADSEKQLLLAMDYEIISKTAPKSVRQLAKRQFPAIKYVYKNKKRLKNILGDEKYNTYLKENIELKNDFIYSLMKWNNQSIFHKFMVCLKYHFLKIYRKLP